MFNRLLMRPVRTAAAALLFAALTLASPAESVADATPALPATPAFATGGVLVMVQTDPDGSTATFSFSHSFGSSSSPVVPSPVTLGDGQLRVFNSVTPGVYTMSISMPDGWHVVPSGDGYDTGCWDDQDNSTISLSSGVATINVSAGEFIVCTFVLRRKSVEPWSGHVQLLSSPRGLGYWRNRGGCLQADDPNMTSQEAAFVRRSLRRGSEIYPVGSVSALTCAESTRLLWSVDFDGVNRANDAAYHLAAQLIAAKLNRAAGVPVPACVLAAIDAADQLLGSLSFSGRGGYLGPGSGSQRNAAMQLAGVLSRYNEAEPTVLAGSCG